MPTATKRVNMRIPEDLLDRIKTYAKASNTTVTADYVAYLRAKFARKGTDDGQNLQADVTTTQNQKRTH